MCGGIAERFDLDPTLVRVGFAALLLGIALLVVGGIALLQSLPMLWALGLDVLRFSIPLAIIAVGLLLLMSRGRR